MLGMAGNFEKPRSRTVLATARTLRIFVKSARYGLRMLGGGGPAGPAVYDQAALEGGVVAAGDQVVRAHLPPRAERLQDAAAQLIAKRGISEEGEMRRAAPWGYAAEDRVGQDGGTLSGQTG